MATYYALSTLTGANWSTPSCWAATSGGTPLTGGYPNSNQNDDVIFDANSGPSRTITLNNVWSMRTLKTVGANPMTFTGSTLNIGGGTNTTASVDLTGTVSFAGLNFLAGTNNTCSLKAPNVPIASLILAGTVSLLSDLTVTTSLVFNDPYDTDDQNNVTNIYPYSFTTNNYTLSIPNLNIAVWNAYVTLNFGSSMLILTGNASDLVTITVGAVVPSKATGTVKIARTGTTAAGISIGGPTSFTYQLFAAKPNLWIASPYTGAGSFTLATQNNYPAPLSNLRIDTGTVKVTPSVAVTADTFSITGTYTSPVTLISSSSPTRANITKATAGVTYMDYVTCKDINFSPAGTFVVRGGTDLGNNNNVTFYRAKPNFAAFF